jgi:hypothetical protein
MRRGTFAACSIIILGVVALLLAACRKNEDSPATPPPDVTPPYGKGSLSFTASDSGKFSVNGPYKPSTQTASDSAGSGAGGFLEDMVVGGKRLKGELMSYKHSLAGGMLDDRVFLVELYDSVGVIAAGDYNLVRPDTTAAGKFAVATYIYYSNLSGLYYVYQSKIGTVTISSVDASTNHLTGSFSGTLRGIPPDTANVVQIVHGEFDVKLGSAYFVYKQAIR